MIAKLQKFFHLPRDDRRLFLKAGFLQVLMRFGLWLLSFRRLMRLVDRLGCPLNMLPTDPLLPEKIAWAVNAACPYVPRGTCLSQALAARIMLKRIGSRADLRIGVAKNEYGQVQAHAWIVGSGGVVIVGAGNGNYVLLENIGDSVNPKIICGLE